MSPGVLDKFAEIVYLRLKDYHEVIEERTMDDNVVKSFQKSVTNQDEKRRTVVKKIVNLITTAETLESKKDGFILLPLRTIKFVTSNDFSWLVEWLLLEKDDNVQKVLTDMIRYLFNPADTHNRDLIHKAREKNSVLKQETDYLFNPIALDSEQAKQQKQRWENEQKWSKKEKPNEEDELLKKISIPRIKDLLVKAENGDTDSWWRLQYSLCIYNHQLDEEDIKELPGWKLLDEQTQERIINYGKTFLFNQESKPEEWLGKNKIYHPAIAGFRAIKIYYEKERSFLESLDKDIWKKWAPIIIGMPLISNDPDYENLIALAYKNAPEEIINTLDVLIDDEEKDGILPILNVLNACVDERMTKFLLNKANKNGFNLKAAGVIQNFLLRHRIQSANDYVKSLIKLPLPTDENLREQSLIAAAVMLWNAYEDDWDYLWKLIIKDNDFGRQVIIKAHEHFPHRSEILPRLNEAQLAKLYIWLVDNFPPEKYFQPMGVHEVTPRISIGDWRDAVLRALMHRGTAEACKQVQFLADALPQYPWIKEFTLLETRRIALMKSWPPPKTDQLLELVENHELRLVNSPDELMEVIMNSLHNLQNKLQRGEPPQAIDVWNERRLTDTKTKKKVLIYSPMEENRLSDKIKIHLQEELDSKGVIVNREVRIKQGNETDIHISTFSKDELGRPKDLLKVTIEVKCSWNSTLDTAMEQQLADRYLTGNGSDRGIYLVGWYQCDTWNDKADSRKKKCPRISIEEAQNKYDTQAKQLSEKKPIHVKSFVLDVRLT